jgi:Flp pilus assembly protein TadB
MKFKNTNYKNVIIDAIFYGFGSYLFFDSLLLGVLVLIPIGLLIYYKKAYQSDLYYKNFSGFIEFLNHINAHLSVGLTFKNSIINFNASKDQSRQLAEIMHALHRIMNVNGTTGSLMKEIETAYPIEEAKIFTNLMGTAITSNVQSAYIVNKTLDILYLKKETYQEVELILFQKKMEQAILCMAPLAIIAFIRTSASEYLEILYTTLQGRGIMAFAFVLLILMKLISDYIVKIKLES